MTKQAETEKRVIGEMVSGLPPEYRTNDRIHCSAVVCRKENHPSERTINIAKITGFHARTFFPSSTLIGSILKKAIIPFTERPIVPMIMTGNICTANPATIIAKNSTPSRGSPPGPLRI